MYTRNNIYVPLPTDPESTVFTPHRYGPSSLPYRFKYLLRNSNAFRFGLISFVMMATVLMTIYEILWGGAMIFHPYSKPAYLNLPVDRPLVLRLAIIARVDGFERREAIREAVLDGVPASDVSLEYKFFVGRARGNSLEAERTMRKLEHENSVHGDIVIMRDIEDVPERISEKRYNALKWVSPSLSFSIISID